jgi:hypothetical protein
MQIIIDEKWQVQAIARAIFDRESVKKLKYIIPVIIFGIMTAIGLFGVVNIANNSYPVVSEFVLPSNNSNILKIETYDGITQLFIGNERLEKVSVPEEFLERNSLAYLGFIFFFGIPLGDFSFLF